ncbi:MAG: tryptophan--tRNA ligase [Candidatus Paceibacterota bacterium]|jgi:tryptophanyl-tRNA synthetase
MKPVLVSGIQPSGNLHLGNYLGALTNFITLQNSNNYECYFFIADLHSITEDYNPKEKQKQILNLAEDYLAAGLDPKKCIIFQQSSIPAHTELMWILNTITPMGELMRMTQFKEKLTIKQIKETLGVKNIPGEDAEKISQETNELRIDFTNVGLFDYPVLMAADILLYGASVVPVGHDQLQHLELARTLARKFNARFGKTFIEPKPLMTEVPRLMSLDDPEKKMSKSRPAGCVFIDEAPEVIRKKIMSAVTDSMSEVGYDEEKRPAMANLLLLYSAMSNTPIPEIVKNYRGKGYADFKRGLADVVIEALTPFQKRKKELKINEVKKILEEGNKKANVIAEKKREEIQKKVGLAL